ncbi:lipopolysaccharide 1,2-N-acetylglucosaminetransferase, partial [Klebsiella michiganensis]
NVADMTIDAVWPAIKAQADALIAARQQA